MYNNLFANKICKAFKKTSYTGLRCSTLAPMFATICDSMLLIPEVYDVPICGSLDAIKT